MGKIINVAGVRMEQGVISTSEFIQLPCHTIWDIDQRFYKRIKSKERGEHLRGTFKPNMGQVSVAVFPNGRKERLDGNSRATAINLGYLKHYPEELFVTYYHVRTQEESNNIFEGIDHKFAADNAADTLAYALNAAEIKLSSPLLKGSISSAVKQAADEKNVAIAVSNIATGLKVVDGLMVVKSKVEDGQRVLSTGALAAILCYANMEEYDAVPLIAAYINGGKNVKLTNFRNSIATGEKDIKGASGTKSVFEDLLALFLEEHKD